MKKIGSIIIITMIVIVAIIYYIIKPKEVNLSNTDITSTNIILPTVNMENVVTETKQETTQIEAKKNGRTVVIDPGHQTKGDNSKEPIGPGATETKAKVTTGATGVATRQTESELNLKVALLLKNELENKGYTVIMTRTTNNVNISNIERATIANNANANAFIRIHADSAESSSAVRNVCFMSNI